MADEEFTVFLGKNIVSHRGHVHPLAQFPAELKHERCFAAADRPAHTHGEGPLPEIAIAREIPVMEVSGVLEMFVGMAVRAVAVGMRMVHG